MPARLIPPAPESASGSRGLPAIFLDKDGTLVEDVPYNTDPERIQITTHAGAGLRRLAGAGFRLVVITNQPGIALGYFPPEALDGVRARLDALLAADGVALDGFFYCPHAPAAADRAWVIRCACRKPAPGLLARAARELGLDLARSWMIGDILHDVEAGNRAGCRTVLLDVGHETEWCAGPYRTPTIVARDLRDAAEQILAPDGARSMREPAPSPGEPS